LTLITKNSDGKTTIEQRQYTRNRITKSEARPANPAQDQPAAKIPEAVPGHVCGGAVLPVFIKPGWAGVPFVHRRADRYGAGETPQRPAAGIDKRHTDTGLRCFVCPGIRFLFQNTMVCQCCGK